MLMLLWFAAEYYISLFIALLALELLTVLLLTFKFLRC